MDMSPRHLARFPNHGRHKPPFKAGTPEYVRWYARVRTQALKEGVTDWPAYYARAKVEAVKKPPDVATRCNKQRGLFGGALTPAYRAWYYRTQCAARALNVQDWPEFFAKAKNVEMRKQGLMPHNVVPFNPQPEDTDNAPPTHSLRFDFSVPHNTEHHLLHDSDPP